LSYTTCEQYIPEKKKKKEREREEGGLGGLDDLAEGNGAGGESKDRETCN